MTLKRLIDAQGFPPGVLITPNARAWDEAGVAMLRGLAFKADCAILLLAHPSVAGMSSGSGLSGWTSWDNSVRSRL